MFVIHLEIVDCIGDTVFLGLILLAIWCVCAGLVQLLEVVDEFGMDTHGTGNDAHDVPGERSGLVGASNEGVFALSCKKLRIMARFSSLVCFVARASVEAGITLNK